MILCLVLPSEWNVAASRSASFLSSAPTNGTTLTLNFSSGTIEGCETIQAEVWVNNVTDLYGVDIRLEFDPDIVQVVPVNPATPGDPLEPGGFLQPPLWTVRNRADNVAGTIDYVTTQLNPTPGQDGSGILVIIHLRAKNAGLSDLEFRDGTTLGNSDAQPVPATPIDGSVTTQPPGSSVLTISKPSPPNAHLSWTGSADPDVVEYHLYRDTTPYFTPTDPPHKTVTGLSYDDAGVLGNAATNYYYVVRAACDNGFESANSNRVGEFDFDLVASGYNMIALPLQVPAITDADSLAQYVCWPHCTDQVWSWVAADQNWQVWLPKPPAFGFNFLTRTGGAYFLLLDSTAPAVVTFVGGVPDRESITFPITPGSGGVCSQNLISIPLDKDGITNADELAADMGDTVDQTWNWVAASQNWQYRLPKPPAFGPNFSTRIGYPYFVCVDQYAPATWPVY